MIKRMKSGWYPGSAVPNCATLGKLPLGASVTSAIKWG